MAEWLKAPVLKTGEVNTFGGSNPSLSASLLIFWLYMRGKNFIDSLSESEHIFFALDVSKNFIGIAKSDKSFTLATPLYTIQRVQLKKDLVVLKNLVEASVVGAFVVGYPLDLTGNVNRQTQSVRDFCVVLFQYFSIPIIWQDERFSTKMALNYDKIKTNIDARAAACFLQIFLDKLPNLNNEIIFFKY